MTEEPKNLRFITPTQAAEELNVKPNRIHAMIKAGELRAIQIGGRGVWRVERTELEAYIQRQYAAARENASQHETL